MRTRHLSLRRETLAALATDDLANVAGAAAHTLDLQCVLATLSPAQSVVHNPRSSPPCESSPCTR